MRVMTTPQGTGAPTNLWPLTLTLPMGFLNVTMGALFTNGICAPPAKSRPHPCLHASSLGRLETKLQCLLLRHAVCEMRISAAFILRIHGRQRTAEGSTGCGSAENCRQCAGTDMRRTCSGNAARSCMRRSVHARVQCDGDRRETKLQRECRTVVSMQERACTTAVGQMQGPKKAQAGASKSLVARFYCGVQTSVS